MRRLAAVVAALVIALNAMAQSHAGVTGGYNTSGYHAGITVYQPLGLGFALQPSLVYAAKGTDWDEIISCKMGFIELPVQLQAGLDLLLFRPYLFVEPFVGYAVNGKLTPPAGLKELQLSDIENCLEYGLGLGGGVHLGRSFQLSIKYFWNFDNCGFGDYLASVNSAFSERKQFTGMAVSASILF